MNRSEHLFTILAEEAVEVAHRVTKVLRFGLLEVQPGQTATNVERLHGELCDLAAVLEMLADEHPCIEALLADQEAAAAQIVAKRVKVEKFLAFSRELGTLQP